MQISEIKGKVVKVGKTSITVKDKGNKTCGVVTGVTKFHSLQPNRQGDYFKQLREAGVWGSGIDGILDCVVFKERDMYYLNNTKPLEFYQEYLSDVEGELGEREKERYNQRLNIAENMKKYATVIDCKIL